MTIFVFGSNLAGIHGAGAARDALEKHGAQWGVGEGRTGNAYALPTKNHNIQTMSSREVATYVLRFCAYANKHPEETFFVTRIGCGLAGFRDFQIAPMFRCVPSNCILPIEWKALLDEGPWQFHSWDDNQKPKM